MDVMLGAGVVHGQTPAQVPGQMPGVAYERLEAVDRVLKILAQAPETEPPADLVQRTLRRIAQESFSGRAVASSLPETAVASTQPHA